jgi:hypothetical protein
MSIATSMSIRPAQVEDAGNISALINSLAGHFTLHTEGLGAEEFLQSIQPVRLQNEFNLSINGAVSPPQLWQYAQKHALASNQVDEFTVNATPYSVPVYERFGFVVAGDRVERKGIAYVPMILKKQ